MDATNILASEKVVAVSDKYKSVYPLTSPQPMDFGYGLAGPDGKIYGPGAIRLHMHRIDYPDEEGTEAQMKQHIVNTVNNAIPYQLSPGLLPTGPGRWLWLWYPGLNNYAVAKFRYEVDTADYLRVRFTDLSYYRPETWQWDFGDGATFEGRKPYWHTFPQKWYIMVCLTVKAMKMAAIPCAHLFWARVPLVMFSQKRT